MRRRRNEIREGSIEREIAELGERIADLPVQELRGMARSAAAHPRRLRAGDGTRRVAFRPRLRWIGVAVATALLVGSGLGFGLASTATPSGTAGTSVVGFGFLPAKGWTVVQSGTVDPATGANAIAANVPLHPDDDLEGTPYATLDSLPRGGVLIHAIFTTRGDPAQDFKFDERTLPLDLAGEELVSMDDDASLLALGIAQRRLRVAIRGYNVDARIYFGAAQPLANGLAAAQRQLNRLVVAAERVTLVARPTALRWSQAATLFGAVDNGRADEEVTIQAKDCGQRSFTGVASVSTHAGGTWTREFGRGITTTVRAVWKGAASAPVTIRQQPRLVLARRGPMRFEVGVGSKGFMWRKRVLFQRRDRGAWRTVRSVVLTDTFAQPGSSFPWTSAEFTARLPRGSLVRTVLPRAQARPCYLATVSNTLRT